MTRSRAGCCHPRIYQVRVIPDMSRCCETCARCLPSTKKMDRWYSRMQLAFTSDKSRKTLYSSVTSVVGLFNSSLNHRGHRGTQGKSEPSQELTCHQRKLTT